MDNHFIGPVVSRAIFESRTWSAWAVGNCQSCHLQEFVLLSSSRTPI